MLNNNNILIKELYKENLIYEKKAQKLNFEVDDEEECELRKEFISFIYYKSVSELCPASNANEDTEKKLSKYVYNLDYKKIKKHYDTYALLSRNKSDKDVTYYEYLIFINFNHLDAVSLFTILEYLTFNSKIKIKESLSLLMNQINM